MDNQVFRKRKLLGSSIALGLPLAASTTTILLMDGEIYKTESWRLSAFFLVGLFTVLFANRDKILGKNTKFSYELVFIIGLAIELLATLGVILIVLGVSGSIGNRIDNFINKKEAIKNE